MNKFLLICTVLFFFNACKSTKNETSSIVENGQKTPIQYANEWSQVGPSVPFKDKLEKFNDYSENYWFGNGRVSSIWIDPENDDHLLIGVAFSSLHETFDGGKTWKSLTDDVATMDVSRIIKKENTLYISTGYRFKNPLRFSAYRHEFYGYGVLKSIDNGKTWSKPGGEFYCGDFSIGETHKTIYATSFNKVYKSIDNAISFEEVANFKSSKEVEINDKIELFSVIVHPRNENIVWVTAAAAKNKEAKIFYKSIDGGKTWQNQMPNLYSFVKEKPNKANRQFIRDAHLFYNKDTDKMFIHFSLAIMYKHENSNKESKKVHSYILKSSDFTNFNLIHQQEIIGGTHFTPKFFEKEGTFYLLAWYLQIKKPTDTKFINVGARKVHQDTRSVAIDKNGTIYYGNDAGIVKSDDKGENWKNAYYKMNANLVFEMSYYSDKEKRRIAIGTQDTGFYLFDLDSTPRYPIHVREGGIYQSPHQLDRNYVKDFDVRVTNNGGLKYSTLELNNGKKTYTQHKDGMFIEDPVNKNRVYLGHVNDLYVSDSLGKKGTWKLISPKKEWYGRSSDLAIPTSNNNVLYLANYKVSFPVKQGNYTTHKKQTNLLKSLDRGKTWENLNESFGNLFNHSVITDIAIANDNPNNIWISLRNSVKGKKAYHSNDGGKSWLNITYNLPNVPANRIVYNEKLNLLLLANDQSVYHLKDEKWIEFGENLPKSIITGLEIDAHYREVICSTFGRGVWRVKF